jgi:DNA-binding protein H-NS
MVKANYKDRDVQFIERLYLLGLKEYLFKQPANTELDFLEEIIEKQRKKVDDLKNEFYESKEINKTATVFYRENLKRQHIYLDLLLEKKKGFESNKKPSKTKKLKP